MLQHTHTHSVWHTHTTTTTPHHTTTKKHQSPQQNTSHTHNEHTTHTRVIDHVMKNIVTNRPEIDRNNYFARARNCATHSYFCWSKTLTGVFIQRTLITSLTQSLLSTNSRGKTQQNTCNAMHIPHCIVHVSRSFYFQMESSRPETSLNMWNKK